MTRLYPRVFVALSAPAWILCTLCATCFGGESDDMPAMGSSEETYRAKITQLVKDRDNVLAQARKLMEQKRNWRVEAGSLESLAAEKENLRGELNKVNDRVELQMEEIEAAKKEIEEAQDAMDELSRRQEKLASQLATVEEQHSKSLLGRKLRDLRKERDILYRDKNRLSDELDRMKKKNASLGQRSEREKATLMRQYEDAQKQFAEKSKERDGQIDKMEKILAVVQKEKEGLSREIKRMPGEFARMARHKQRLLEDTANMHYNLGVFYSKQKDYRRALAEFEEAVRLKPDHALAAYNLGHLYAAYYKDRDKAVEYFKKYLGISPDAADKNEVVKYITTWESWTGDKEVQ